MGGAEVNKASTRTERTFQDAAFRAVIILAGRLAVATTNTDLRRRQNNINPLHAAAAASQTV